MAQEGTPFLIPFGAHGMVAHPDRWLAQPGELTLAENVVLENDLLQKEPSARYYHITNDPTTFALDFFEVSGAFGAAGDLLAGFVAFESAVNVAVVPTVSAGASAPGVSWVIAISGPAEAGDLHVLSFSREAGTGGISALVDSKGHTYTNVLTQSGSGMQIEIWAARLLVDLTTSDTLTATLSNGASDVGIIGGSYAGVTTTTPISAVASGFGTAAATTFYDVFTIGPRQPYNYPVVVISAAANTVGTTHVAGNSFLDVATTTGGNHTTNQSYRVYLDNGGIITQIEWTPDTTSSPAGTVSTTAGSTTVTGAGTTFTNHRPGDVLVIDSEERRILSIASNTSLTVTAAFDLAHSGVAYTRRAGPVMITASLLSGLRLWKEAPLNGANGQNGNLRFTQLRFLSTGGTKRLGKFVVGGKEIAANNRKLFFLNGTSEIQVLSGDGTTMADIANGAADWGAVSNSETQPINAIVHQDSLVAFGNRNDAHRLYISSPDDHEDFRTAPTSNAITLRVASQIGQRLMGAAQYQGVLYLWKYPVGIFYLDDTPIDRLQWGYRIRSTAVGCAPSPHAVLPIDDDVIFCDSNGHFHLLSAVATLGGTFDSDITRMYGLQEWSEANIHVPSLEQLTSTYDSHSKQAWFGMRSIQAVANHVLDNDLIIRFDFSNRFQNRAQASPIRITTSRAWRANSLAVKHRDFVGKIEPMIGEIHQVFFVVPQSYGTRTDYNELTASEVVEGMSSRIDLPEMDFNDSNAALRHIRKRFVAMEIVAQGENFTQPLTVELRVDGVLKQTLTFQQTNVRRILKPLRCGDGYAITARCTTTGAVAGDLPLLGIIFYYFATSTDHSRKS